MTAFETARRLRHRLAWGLAAATLLFGAMGLAAGAEGWRFTEPWQAWRDGGELGSIVWQIRAPRTLGAWSTGALLGLAGAIAQGLFRNPLADPYLLGSASGASLGVMCVLAASTALAGLAGAAVSSVFAGIGLAGAAFLGALVGVSLTLLLAGGAQQGTRLLLAGVVVGVVLAAAGDLLATLAPETLRARQAFLLGSTAFVDWPGCGLMASGLGIGMALAWRHARALDALTLGSATAASLGVDLPVVRRVLIGALALATGLAVSQSGLIAFVGLAAPHLVRRAAPSTHRAGVAMSAVAGGVLLLAADLAARTLLAPRELPVGVLTALLGGSYLLVLLHRGRVR